MSKAQETQNAETTEQVREKEHSPKFWDITAEEYTEITGKQYL